MARSSGIENYQRLMLERPQASGAMPRGYSPGHKKRPTTAGSRLPTPGRQHLTMSAPTGDGPLEGTELPKRGASVSGRLPELHDDSPRKKIPDWHRVPYEPSTTSVLRNSAQATFNEDDVPCVELQAAFERAYERMLQNPPPSVIDTVLSMQYVHANPPPNTARSQAPTSPGSTMRPTRPRRNPPVFFEKEKSWDTRAPATSRGIAAYDAVTDLHCRRVVENPHFRRQLKSTRPDSTFLLHRRVLAEESRVNLARGKRQADPPPTWLQLLTQPPRPMTADDEAAEALLRAAIAPEGAERKAQRPTSVPSHSRNSDSPSSMPRPRSSGGPSTRDGPVKDDEGQDNQEGAAESGEYREDFEREGGDGGEEGEDPNGFYSSLQHVLSDGPHLPAVFAHLVVRLEGLWEQLRVPRSDRRQVRRMFFRPVSPGNLSHLFYQVSRWTQYQTQLNVALGLIVQREQLFKDVNDHLTLSGGVVDETLGAKLSAFYALSLRSLNAVTALKTLFAGEDNSQALLQDYVGKIKTDTAALRDRHPEYQPQPPRESADMSATQSVQSAVDHLHAGPATARSTGGTWEDGDYQLRQSKVHLAAELVLEDVGRTAKSLEEKVNLHYHQARIGIEGGVSHPRAAFSSERRLARGPPQEIRT